MITSAPMSVAADLDLQKIPGIKPLNVVFILSDELYDLQNDPHEQHNLIFDPEHQPLIKKLRAELHKILVANGANRVPFSLKRGMGANLRLRSGSQPADFPPQLLREKNAQE